MLLVLLALLFEIARHFLPWAKPAVYWPRTVFAHVGAVNTAQGFQHLDLFITDAVGAEIGRRRHGNHAQDLQQVVLDHVAHLPGLVEVTPAPFNTHLFRDGDFDVIDGAAVPVIDEQELAKRSASRLRTVSLPR